MKKLLIILAVFMGLQASLVYSAQNLDSVYVDKIETRDVGITAVYFSGQVPHEGCVLADRAVIGHGSSGKEDMLSVATTALLTGKLVSIRVDGCTDILGSSGNTAPVIVRINLYR